MQNTHLSGVEIQLRAAEGSEFAEPQTRERRQQDEAPEPRADGVGDVEHLINREHGPLSRLLLPGAADAAGVAAEQAVVGCSVEDGVQEAVRLRRG